MSILDHHPLNKALAKVLVHGSPVPEMPAARIEAAAMAGVPIAGTNWIPGRNGSGF